MKNKNDNKKCYICDTDILPGEKSTFDEDGEIVHLSCLEWYVKTLEEEYYHKDLVGY